MSITYSTIINCSLLDIIHRIKKIQLQNNILSSELNENISFPRIEHKVKTTQVQSRLPIKNNNYEVIIEEAKKKAIADAHKFNLEPGELNCNLPLIVDDEIDNSEDDENRNKNNNCVDTRENNTVISDSIRASTLEV